jgi:hypothetical protein
MKPITLSPKQTTAIPVRFWRQRERVLQILARWERTAQTRVVRSS